MTRKVQSYEIELQYIYIMIVSERCLRFVINVRSHRIKSYFFLFSGMYKSFYFRGATILNVSTVLHDHHKSKMLKGLTADRTGCNIMLTCALLLNKHFYGLDNICTAMGYYWNYCYQL